MIYNHPGKKPFSLVFGMIAIIAIMAMSSGCKLIENLHPELAMRGEDSMGSHKCGECHIDIYNEWAESSHSKSYISEEFRVATNNYEFKFCIRCHVPETIFTSLEVDSDKTVISLTKSKNGEIAPRDYNLNDGVDCHGCHLTVDCTLAGPHSGISPHPIEKKEELFKSSELCGKCHVDYIRRVFNVSGKWQ